MLNNFKSILLLMVLSVAVGTPVAAETPAPAKPGAVYGDYRDWRVLGVSHRLDKNFVRSILGNTVAINAARSGKTAPWPDGTVIAKLSWHTQTHPKWPQAIVPGEFAGAEAMVKNSQKYKESGGWGFGRWEGQKLVMNDKQQTDACLACHNLVKDSDYVFTMPVLR